MPQRLLGHYRTSGSVLLALLGHYRTGVMSDTAELRVVSCSVSNGTVQPRPRKLRAFNDKERFAESISRYNSVLTPNRELQDCMPVFAAVDIGSNSVRLKISRLQGQQASRASRRRAVTRLGDLAFRTGYLAPDAWRTRSRSCGVSQGAQRLGRTECAS